MHSIWWIDVAWCFPFFECACHAKGSLPQNGGLLAAAPDPLPMEAQIAAYRNTLFIALATAGLAGLTAWGLAVGLLSAPFISLFAVLALCAADAWGIAMVKGRNLQQQLRAREEDTNFWNWRRSYLRARLVSKALWFSVGFIALLAALLACINWYLGTFG